MSTPARTVTFLFTDIEGSTQWWEKHPGEMQAALARHDQILRGAIEGNQGSVFKTIGDAFCATFESSSNGLSACREAQLALDQETWPEPIRIKVRMALHSGPAESRDMDFFGQSVNRVARLLAVAHGGQTILSQGSFELLGDPLPEGVELRDLGVHRLKDLLKPERVYQADMPGLATAFPPLRSLDSSAGPNNLPAQVTSFVGRANELKRVGELLERSRAVTLTGSGGCGKTRLAIQVAAEASERYRDGIWIAELASLTEPDAVSMTLASLLAVRQEHGQTIMESLVSQIRQKRLLVILDNCEHLLEACADLVSVILRSCPNVSVLATSREPMNIAGEATFRVPSLASPDPQKHKTPQDLEQFESVRLFIERATAVTEDFQVTNANAPALASLCAQLDGIPLAIELAAARIRSLSVEQIATRLEDRFRLLTGGSRSALPRQQTLRALVDWSYNLLQEPERALLRRLSVFAGGWRLEAAEDVVAGEPVESWEVLDLLTSLIDKSLVSFDPNKEEDRYRLLETVKRYGRDKLQEVGEGEAYFDRHLQWYSSLAEQAGSWVRGPKQKEWLSRLEEEHDNLWLAMQTSHERKDWRTSGQLAWTLAVLLQFRGFMHDAVKAIDSGLAAVRGHEGSEPLVLARLEYERAGLHQDFGEASDATVLAEKSLAAFEACEDVAGMARAKNLLGQIAMGDGSYESAGELFGRALELFERAGDQLGVAIVKNNQGVLARRLPAQNESERMANLAGAKETLLEALALRRKLQDLTGEAETLTNLGVLAFERRDYQEAWSHYRDALAIEKELRHTHGIATALANLGEVAGILGDLSLAVQLLAASQKVFEEAGSQLAGAVRSMLMELVDDPDTGEASLLIASTRSKPIEDSIALILAKDLVVA